MITKITTHVVYCDGDHCDESFGDNVATSAEVIARLAVTVGKWRVRPRTKATALSECSVSVSVFTRSWKATPSATCATSAG
jgi:hypothetical protein